MCKSDTFHTLILLYRREIDKQYLHCLVSMLFWHLANWISIRHALTYFLRHPLITISFQVFHNPLSGNAIGHHTMWIFIIPQIPNNHFRKHVTSYSFILSKSLLIMIDYNRKLYKCILLYCIWMFIPQLSIHVKFFSVYNHVLCK